MVQCLDGVKRLCAAFITCCETDIYKQPKGLEDPEALARETVCMLPSLINFPIIDVRKCTWEKWRSQGGQEGAIAQSRQKNPLIYSIQYQQSYQILLDYVELKTNTTTLKSSHNT